MHTLTNRKGELKTPSAKRLKTEHGDLFTRIAATVPAHKATVSHVRETTVCFYINAEYTQPVPAIEITTVADNNPDHHVRTMTWWEDEDGRYHQACPMCIDGFRPEYKGVNNGTCYHCGGSNTGSSKTADNRDRAIAAVKRASQADLTKARTWSIFTGIHHAKVDEFWATHPEAASARDTFNQLVDSAARAGQATDPYAEPGISLDQYVKRNYSQYAGKVNHFAYRMIEEAREKASLTPRQLEAFVSSVAKTAEREATKEARAEELEGSTRFVGKLGERLKFDATVKFARVIENEEFGDSVMMILEGADALEGAVLKVFSGGGWAWEAFEAWEETKDTDGAEPVRVRLSGTVKQHSTTDQDGNVTRLANVRKVKKI